MARRKRVVKLSKKQAKYQQKLSSRPLTRADFTVSQARPVISATPKMVAIPKIVNVRQLGELFGLPAPKLIMTLLKNGLAVNINQPVDFETAVLLGDQLGITVEPIHQETTHQLGSQHESGLTKRAPIVAVMGHVDHGKTSILDYIRQTNVADGEPGGITQHIGAYQANGITFLDTPGHEAFSILRAHGASVTDIVVLVVAADEGVKPQTLEALSHAQAANIPVIVAINKIDLPDADPERIKKELAGHGLNPDTWGGETPFVEVSAKTGRHIKELLDTIHLVAEFHNYQANPTGPARGTVIESTMKKGVGPTATVVIRGGLLRKGDRIVFQKTWGKVRTIKNWLGEEVDIVSPSQPVQVTGLKGLPGLGETFTTIGADESTRGIAEGRITDRASLLSFTSESDESNIKPIILKTDSIGSLESIRHSIQDLTVDSRHFLLIYTGVGDITESDVNLAKISHAWVVAFRVKLPGNLALLAQQTGVTVASYQLIYELLDEAKEKLQSPPTNSASLEITEAKILKTFRDDAQETLVGALVTGGTLKERHLIEIKRGEETIGIGSIDSLRQARTKISRATTNTEVGIIIRKGSIWPPGNLLPNDIVHVVPKNAHQPKE